MFLRAVVLVLGECNTEVFSVGVFGFARVQHFSILGFHSEFEGKPPHELQVGRSGGDSEALPFRKSGRGCLGGTVKPSPQEI